MLSRFLDSLVDAQGRSEFVIVVVVDIRGFSRFSTRHESPDIAMFIKRFYLRLINDYFPTASFVKPTGDGLLMTFRYDEKSLSEVAKVVIDACIKCLGDFPTLCKDDPMINFSLPDALGFGIARGTACCLFSGEEILDYSGHLLNLASRLNDLARPKGIVIDGAFLDTIIPESARSQFKKENVYVRSIAEDTSLQVFYLEKHVRISGNSLIPLSGEHWISVVNEFAYSDLLKLSDIFFVHLESPPKGRKKIKVTLITPKRGFPKLGTFRDFKDFKYLPQGSRPRIQLDLKKARETIRNDKIARSGKVKFVVEYVPKPIGRS